MYLIFVPRLHYVHQVHNGNQVPCGPPAALRGVFYCSSKGLYRCRRTIGHFTVGEFTVTGVQLFLFAFLVNSWDIDRKTERRWLGTPPCDIPLRKTAIRAYEGKSSELIPPGPRSRVGTIQLNWVSSAYCPNVTYVLFGRRKALCCCCWCGTSAEINGRFYSSGKSASAGRWRSPSCKLGKLERWRPSR